MYSYDLFEPSADLNASLDMLTAKFAPIYTESWVKEKAPKKGNPPFDMNVNSFANMWFSKAMKLVVAYNDMHEICGYLLGIVFTPMTYKATVFHVEDWYDKGIPEVRDGLFTYIQNAMRFLGVDEVWVSHSMNEIVPACMLNNWNLVGTTYVDCYKKKA